MQLLLQNLPPRPIPPAFHCYHHQLWRNFHQLRKSRSVRPLSKDRRDASESLPRRHRQASPPRHRQHPTRLHRTLRRTFQKMRTLFSSMLRKMLIEVAAIDDDDDEAAAAATVLQLPSPFICTRHHPLLVLQCATSCCTVAEPMLARWDMSNKASNNIIQYARICHGVCCI